MLTKISLSEKEFLDFCDIVYKRCGIELPLSMKKRLESVIAERVRTCGLRTAADYYNSVSCADTESSKEFLEFIKNLVIPETSFFRTSANFDALKSSIIPELIGSENNRNAPLTIWSAGCSIGPEPYTIAIVTTDTGVPVKIIATDISEKSLGEARTGLYPERIIRKVPEDCLKKYFSKKGVDYEISPALRQKVAFAQHNLMDFEAYPKQAHVIFCRNVLIYFSAENRRKIICHFHKSLVPDGYIFLGYSETLRDFPDLFQPVWFNGTYAYKKIPADRQAPKQPECPARLAPIAAVRINIARKGDTAIILRKPSQPQKPQIQIDTLEISGNLDQPVIENGASAVKDQFMKFIENVPARLIINMDKVEYMDNAGLTFLKRAFRHITDSGGKAVFVAEKDSILHWLSKADFKENRDIFRDEESARKFLHERTN